jgi:hypothetical protein
MATSAFFWWFCYEESDNNNVVAFLYGDVVFKFFIAPYGLVH